VGLAHWRGLDLTARLAAVELSVCPVEIPVQFPAFFVRKTSVAAITATAAAVVAGPAILARVVRLPPAILVGGSTEDRTPVARLPAHREGKQTGNEDEENRLHGISEKINFIES
jgi:hypothetical protein